jgi:acetyltransferase-like isoleucine patch superfamily enzyme
MSDGRLMRIHSAEFQAMAERVLQVTELTSRLNVLPFGDEVGKAGLFEQILGRPLPEGVTIYPPFYTDHGLRLDLAERVFINQNCTLLDYAGIRLGERVMVVFGSTSDGICRSSACRRSSVADMKGVIDCPWACP